MCCRAKDVNIEKIPTPVWHELDGGPFIGTACLVVMKDPDSGWVNYGTYRVQSHKPDVASVMMSPGKHGLIIMRKYHERGQPCPVAVIAGMHPSMVMLGGIEIPYGKNELEAAGGILGEPSRSSKCLRPACRCQRMRDRLRGFIHPDDKIQEGPLGEWTGYYASGSDLEPAIRIETLMYRNDPILMGAIPAVPPNDNTFYFGAYRSGAIWNQLEAAGHSRRQRRMGTRGRRQPLHAGDLDQARFTAGTPSRRRWWRRTVTPAPTATAGPSWSTTTSIPTNFNDVIWAMCTRCDPRDQVDIIHGGWSSALDPMCYDTERTGEIRASSSTPASRSGARRRSRRSRAPARRWTTACARNGRRICRRGSDCDKYKPGEPRPRGGRDFLTYRNKRL